MKATCTIKKENEFVRDPPPDFPLDDPPTSFILTTVTLPRRRYFVCLSSLNLNICWVKTEIFVDLPAYILQSTRDFILIFYSK